MLLACLLSFIIGFLSLSQEILWIRLFGFANQSLPQAFSFVLVVYLFGIAVGAIIGNRACRFSFNLWVVSGITLMVASVFDIIGPWIYAYSFQSKMQIATGGFSIFLTAVLKAVIFPIAHHLGTAVEDNHIGRAISKVYVANIIGATLGPIVVGFVILNDVTTQQGFIICAVCTFIVSMCCLNQVMKRSMQIAGFAVVSVVIIFLITRDPSWLMKKVSEPVGRIKYMVENRHGIITIYKGHHGDDIVFGGNVYDGRTNLDPRNMSNGLNRLLVLAAIHDKPRNVLMIGMSIGTWLKMVTGFPDIQNIDVIEINPGYLEAIKHYPKQESALSDPRVHLYMGDGRRYLRTHASNKYDLIIMNTTYYWRAYTTNLLSINFLKMLKQHMQPHAVLAYNMTGSYDAFKTATHVFSSAYLYQNFVIASDDDWRDRLHKTEAITKLANLSLDGKPLFLSGDKDLINSYLSVQLVTIKDIDDYYNKYYAAFGRHLEVVTDHNLITEYKYGKMLWG
jgi:spermidine synthase